MQSRRFWVSCLLLWLCGASLRLTLLAVPPVVNTIQADLGMSGTEVGILAGLPVVLFAAFALPGSLLIARLGLVATLVIGLLIAALGAAIRGALPTVGMLYAGTVVMGAGVAMLQVAAPAAVRQWTPQRIGFATALYTNGLLVGEILPVALTIPLVLPLVGGSWRWSLALWGLPLLAIALMILWLAPPSPERGIDSAAVRWWPDFRSPTLLRLGFVFASITATYFGANGFLPAHLAGAGRADLTAPALSALNIGQLPASFLLLAIAGRLTGRAGPLVALGVLSIATVLAIMLTASYWTVVLAGFLGCVLAGALTLGLTLPAHLSSADDMARTTAGMFSISYLVSVSISVIAGAAWDLTGWTGAAFAVLAAGVLPLVLVTPRLLAPERAGASAG